MPTAKAPSRKPAAKGRKAPKSAKERLAFPEVMRELEKSGSAQTRKTYLRHGAAEPMFGVSFATLSQLRKRIGVDHDLAVQLFDTGNFDAQNLAMKIADPARMSAADLDRWAGRYQVRMCSAYIASLAAEGPHAVPKVKQWLGSSKEPERILAWGLVCQMASRDEATPDAWFAERLSEIERTIRSAPNWERYAMNTAVISIGGRSPALRKAALAAAKRIGTVEVDHGDTSCQTPAAGPYIEKLWTWAESKKFPSPAAQERARQSPRVRC